MSFNLSSVNCASLSVLSFERLLGDGSPVEFGETVIISFFFSNTFHVVEDFVMTSLFWFWFVIPNFCLTVTVFRDYHQRDAPAFLSLLYRFWLSGLFSFERLTAYEIRNPHCLLIPEECFWCRSLYSELRVLRLQCAPFELNERLPSPRFKLKVSIYV